MYMNNGKGHILRDAIGIASAFVTSGTTTSQIIFFI